MKIFTKYLHWHEDITLHTRLVSNKYYCSPQILMFLVRTVYWKVTQQIIQYFMRHLVVLRTEL